MYNEENQLILLEPDVTTASKRNSRKPSLGLESARNEEAIVPTHSTHHSECKTEIMQHNDQQQNKLLNDNDGLSNQKEKEEHFIDDQHSKQKDESKPEENGQSGHGLTVE